MAAGAPKDTPTDSNLAIEANVKQNYVECVTSIQQPNEAPLQPPPTTPPVADSGTREA